MTMLNVYDLQRKKRAVLQNAYNIVEEHEINQIYSLHFSFPASDEKVQYVLPRHYVRYGDDHELYRIKKPSSNESNIDVNTYECEHVITTLCDNVMFGSHTVGGSGMHTAAVIQWILSKQSTQNWVLYECDFDRQFEYLWEQENLLNALYSIPKEFATPYMWVFDTTVYPWRISLKAINPNGTPGYYLRAKSNILSSGTSADYSNICTRLYPLGYGEGVNQLTIKDAHVSMIVYDREGKPANATVNEQSQIKWGQTYIQSPNNIVAKYGIVEKVLVDRRFENADSLMAYAQTTLEAYQEPTMSRSFDVTDLYPLTHQSWDDAEVGKICRMTKDNTTAYITKTRRQYDKAGDLQIDISTKPNDIASNIADLADRVRIESVYAQGATQLYQHSKDANATPTKGMIMSLYFPSEMRQINKVLMRLKLNKFRSYSQTTESNGGYSTTLSVSEESKTITSQTNKTNASVNVTQQSVSIKTQVNGNSEQVQVNLPEKVATVDMTPDTYTDEYGEVKQYNLSTTSDGGGTGQTSVSNNTISINSTTSTKWEYNNGLYATTTAQSALIDNRTKDGEKNSTWDEIQTESASGTATLEGHVHKIWGLMPHQHPIKFNFDIPALNLNLWQLRHDHDIDLSNVGSHNHIFEIGDHHHEINIKHQHKVTIPSQTISVPCPSHTHSVTIPGQTLSVPCPSHNHQITIPGWSKTITIPPHSHGIAAGIYESGNPTAFDIYVDNIKKTTISSTEYNDDITAWLLNNKNQISRNTWIDVEIRPNDLAYVVCSVFVQGFVQSRGGGNY